MATTVRVNAYAKINLFLEITERRKDGYHILSTIFQTISLADAITFRPSESLRLTCSDPSLPTDERNLALSAALRWRQRLNEQKGALIHLKKNIPQGAGLGGGSSDAAAVLATLTTWWRRSPSATLLHRTALNLGADVPFFLKGGTCAAGGIGDRLHPLPPLPKTWLVLVYPGFGISTREAYAKVRVPLTGKRSIHKMTPLLSRPHPSAWVGQLFNRFEEFVFPDHPELPKLKQELLDVGAIGALMSGSGSSVFGVVESAAQGRKVLATIHKKYTQSWLAHTI
jgi:4-diphosphocytidyl-2-C-methyl-D-erythritol kinase